jgi:hypothetical protein
MLALTVHGIGVPDLGRLHIVPHLYADELTVDNPLEANLVAETYRRTVGVCECEIY